MPTFLFFALLIVIAALGSGCQTASSSTVNTNSKPAASNTAAKPETQSKPVESSVPTEATSVGSLATPTDAYKTAYELRKKKDVAGLKKIMS